jgi:hypothetical protein
MKPTPEQLGALLANRRVERPGEAYWQDFLLEFHRRQQEQTAPESALASLWHRLTNLVEDMGSARWAYGAGLAYAAITVAFLVLPSKVDIERPVGTPASHQVIPSVQPAAPTNPSSAKPVEPPLPTNDELF